MRQRVVIPLLLALAAMIACAPSRRSDSSAAPLSAADTSWVAREPVICGEVRGRVLDGRTGRPLPQAYITIDSIMPGVSTDAAGHFRLNISAPPEARSLTRATTIRIRYVGMREQRVYLPANLGYVIEATLSPMSLHADHISTLRIKDPGFCGRAT